MSTKSIELPELMDPIADYALATSALDVASNEYPAGSPAALENAWRKALNALDRTLEELYADET